MVTSFKDLGKSTRELFDKHFKFGFLNFQFKTKTINDITVLCGGSHDTKSQLAAGFLQTKLKPCKGVEMKTKVDSAWVISSEIEAKDKLYESLSHEIIARMETDSGKKSMLVKNKFKHDLVNLTLDVDIKSRYPHITGAFIVPIPQFENIVIGAQAVVDTNAFKLQKHAYVIGFKQDALRMHASVSDLSNVDINVYQEHNDLDIGFRVGWNKDTRETSYGAAIEYKLPSKEKVKVKVDHNCLMGLAYKVKLGPDAELALCAELDAKNLTSGGHRYGLMFEYGD